jgi:signal transduction histidine kinase
MKKQVKPEIAPLRRKAEEQLKGRSDGTSGSVSELEIFRLMHELKVHQIELELQNEELVLARNLAQETADKYTELYDFAPIGYLSLSLSGEIRMLNLLAARMLCSERSKLFNKRLGIFLTVPSRLVFAEFLEDVFNSPYKQSCEIMIEVPGATPAWVQISGILSETGEECLVTALDITARKKGEEEMVIINQRLTEASAEKDKFFSIIAHDLRSPFNAFLGFTQLLLDDVDTLTLREIQRIAQCMSTSAKNLFQLLENLLVWSRFQRGLVKFEPDQFYMGQKMEESVRAIMEVAEKKEIVISLEFPEDLQVYADMNMIGSTIRNLVSNAVKYTPRGGAIQVRAKQMSDNQIEVSVTDNGIGMNPTRIDRLFTLAADSGTIGTEGEPTSGLGLILCREFIEKHGGKIGVTSAEGQGSIFYFSIPAAPNT